MARDIRLNSSEWCDMVFEGRNKKYGAYALRKTSSKRHIVAFLVAILIVAAIAAIPAFLKAVTPPKVQTEGITNPYELEKIVEMQKQEEQIVQPNTPPPPKLIASQMFTPPTIRQDDMVDETRELLTQQELNESNVRISVATVVSDNTDGADIADVLRDNRQITNDPPEEPKVFDVVEVMPQFPGGQNELMRYLGSNIKYPTIAAENGIEGRVVLKFVVEKDGTVSNINVVRSLDPSCDKEAIRVVKAMPKWVAGNQNGRPVAVYFTLPVLFKLQK